MPCASHQTSGPDLLSLDDDAVGLAVPGIGGDALLAQLFLQELASGRLGQCLHHPDVARHRIVRHPRDDELNQLGVVEYRIDGEQIEAFFRSIPTIIEDEPFALEAFTQTLAEIEAAQKQLA